MRGQLWSMDYIAGFSLFIVTIIIAAALLTRTTLLGDDYTSIEQTAFAVSDAVMSEGYPMYWRSDDVIIAGLMTNGMFSMSKAQHLLALQKQDYFQVKAALGTQYDFALVLRNSSGMITPIGTNCSLGLANETKTPLIMQQTIGYYHNGSGNLTAYASLVNATVFSGNIEPLLTNASAYDMLILEHPSLRGDNLPFPDEKEDYLESFVKNGGWLLLVGNLNGSPFGMNTSIIGGTTANVSPDSFFNLSVDITGINPTSWMLTSNNHSRFTAVANASGGSYVASFTYGDGEVKYMGGLSGMMGIPVLNHTTDQLLAISNVSSASCTNATYPDAENLVHLRRYAAYDNEIIELSLAVWGDS